MKLSHSLGKSFLRAPLVRSEVSGIMATNLFGDYGNVALHEALYNSGAKAVYAENCYIWQYFSGYFVKTVEGQKCIDGYFSDWNGWYDARRLTIRQENNKPGHKYLFQCGVYGNVTLDQMNTETWGEGLQHAARNELSWSKLGFVLNASANASLPLVLIMASAYITGDQGFFNNFLLLDLTELDQDGGLTDAQILTKYAGLQYFDNTAELVIN